MVYKKIPKKYTCSALGTLTFGSNLIYNLFSPRYAYIWEQWGTLIEPVASLVPYMVGIGNHEYDHTDGGIYLFSCQND